MINKKIAFLSESGFIGKVPRNFENMRTEYSWYTALNADHFPLTQYSSLKGYDYVIIIWPKGDFTVNTVGSPIEVKDRRILKQCLNQPIIDTLKCNNGKVCFMQEGPSWALNDYDLDDQINMVNVIQDSDIIFCHNEYDINFYKGLNTISPVHVMPTLLIEDSIKSIRWNPEPKTIIGGNMSRWYGGLQSYLTALNYDTDIFVPSSHSKRIGEEQLERLNHLPYVQWLDWMKQLSTFKYAIHLMPTVAAGTFSLNCSFFGIPCIGNELVDTQRMCFPKLSVDVNDVYSVRKLISKMRDSDEFYKECSEYAKASYRENFSEEAFIETMKDVLI